MTDRSRTIGETGEGGSRTTGDDRSADASPDGVPRREFVALGAGASATLLAGCAGDASLPSSGGSDGSGDSDGSDGSQPLTGNFRLLISDAPADIGDFDRLDVTLDRARVFEARDGDDEDDEDEGDEDDEDEEEGDSEEAADEDTEEESDDNGDQNATETDEDDEAPNGTADGGNANESDGDEEEAEADDEDEDSEDDDEDGGRGFTAVELDGATVDLTQVIDEDAMAVFDGEIPAGRYEKIELEVSNVEGVVDGETVDVKLPSEKLQITNGFEVTPDEAVSFVFDINVVKRGKNNGYLLKPVISGSGVAGRDVEVNEIDDEDEDDDEEDDDEDDDDEDEEAEEGGSEADEDDSDDADDNSEGADVPGGNGTDDAENGTAAGS